MTVNISESNYLFNACQVRSEESTRDNYAADLQRALRDELSTPDSTRQFFQSTYPTRGMRDICRGIFERLANGDESNEPSVYRLGSAFGGGKTHTLIALAGAARHPHLISEGVTTVPAELAPAEQVRIVAFTGENSDVVRGALIPGSDRVRAKSLIGHLAWQLGGEFAFNEFKTYDEGFTSPGSEDIRRLLGDRPCLILVDELVQWLDRMQNSGLGGKMANIRTLFSSLVQAVESSPNAVLVITTPNLASDAYQEATQLVLDILNEVDSVFARISHQTIPADLPDLPAILRQRLFSQVDEGARSAVASAYASLCQRSGALIAPLPQDRTALQWFYDNYPIHPDTLRIIVDKIASNSNFQNTRGILRLLGMTVHHLKSSRQGAEALLIHPYHIDPTNTGIHAELTTRIEKGEFESAIAADITSPESTAARIDETRPSRPARRLARATLLASLAPIGSAQGITPGELVRAVITPFDEDPSVVANAIAEFRNSALYISDDPGEAVIRFTTVPNLNRMLMDRRNSLTATEIDQRVKGAISDCFTMPRQRSQNLIQATVFPSAPDIPDNRDSVALGIINYEWFTQESDVLPSALTDFYRNSPAGNGQHPREFKNNFVVLVADRDRNGVMERHARRCLAARYILDHPPESLQAYQEQQLRSELANAEKDLFVAIQKLYVNLYYPSTDHPTSSETLMRHELISPEVASERLGEGQHAVIQSLASRRKLITLDNADLDPESYWERRPNLLSGKVGLNSLREEFAREPGNYMLLNGAVADALLRNALDRKAIVVQDGSGRIITEGRELHSPKDEEAWVYLGKNTCPECHRMKNECQCGKMEPILCTLCGKEQHPGPCEVDPPGDIPTFSGGFQPRPLNELAADLRRHLATYNATAADIANITLGGDTAEFLTYLGTVLGHSCKATVTYKLRRRDELTLEVTGMDLREWSGVLARITRPLEGMDEATTLDANVNIPGDGNKPEQLEHVLDLFPASRLAGMEVHFRQGTKEQSYA